MIKVKFKMASLEIFLAHNEAFTKYEEGDITFQECWEKQTDVIEQCEKLLEEQIESLKRLGVHNSISLGTTEGLIENIEKQTDTEPNIKKRNDQTLKVTCNAGVLSTLISIDDSDDNKKESKPLECPECHTKFANHMQNLRDHIETFHIKVKLHCNHCTLFFPTRKKLWSHLKSAVTSQSGKNLAKSDLYSNQCGLCDGEKMKKIDLRKHIVERHTIFKDIFAITDPNRFWTDSAVKTVNLEEEEESRPLNGDNNNDGDLDTFISQIESNLDKFSKILDDSKTATPRKRKRDDTSSEPKTPKGKLLKNDEDNDNFKKFECKFCEQDFSSKQSPSSSLTQHMEKVHYRLQYTCNSCEDFSTADKIYMTEHIEESHVTATNFKKKQLDVLHREHTSYICSVCAEVFEEMVEVIDHMEEEHMDQLERKSMVKQNKEESDPRKANEKTPLKMRTKPHGPKGKMIQCPQCSFKTYILWNLKVHLGTHLGAMFGCTVCHEKFRRKFDLTEHIRDKHPDPKMANSGYSSETKKWLDSMTNCSCEVCGFSKKSVSDYDEHLHAVHELPFGPDKN